MVEILALGPGSSRIPSQHRKKLPRKIIFITSVHVEKWRGKTRNSRKVMAEREKLAAGTAYLCRMLREYVERALLQSETDRQMPPEVYLEEERGETREWAERCLMSLPKLEDFLTRFMKGAITSADCKTFWKHVDRCAINLSF
jgi:hypothetical protein